MDGVDDVYNCAPPNFGRLEPFRSASRGRYHVSSDGLWIEFALRWLSTHLPYYIKSDTTVCGNDGISSSVRSLFYGRDGGGMSVLQETTMR